MRFKIGYTIYIYLVGFSFSINASVVDQLLEKKQQKIKENRKGEHVEGLEVPSIDVLMKPYKELYSYYESRFEAAKKGWPVWEVTGAQLNYTMSFDEIQNAVKEKFKNMFAKGQVIAQKDFENSHNEWLKRDSSLDRIWGAQYLEKKFAEDKRNNFKVPQYLIVADDLSKIKVRVHFATCYPVIDEIENGVIYAKSIQGAPVARKGSNMVGYGYTDYSDPGNILKTSDGIYYVVDTEFKSFYDEHPEDHFFKNAKGGASLACEFYRERFKLQNKINENDKIIEFSLR